jgi:hypothetical protein
MLDEKGAHKVVIYVEVGKHRQLWGLKAMPSDEDICG